MATDLEIGRINLLLEYLAECAATSDLGSLLQVAAGRVRWVLEFDRFSLALGDAADARYWTVIRERERLEPITPSALDGLHREMISRVLRQDAVTAKAGPVSVLCLPIQTNERQLGAICFSNDGGMYSYRDARFVHQIAQFLSGTIARLLQAETIRRQASELQIANRAKDEFLAILGHELRNPLAPILLSIELLRRRLAPEEPHELAVIQRQTEHVVRLVDDMLDVTRLTRGTLELIRSPVETSVLLARAIEVASPLIEARRHRVEIDVPSTGWCVDGDEDRLTQVFANLLTNAARYTEPGGLIQVVARQTDDFISVDVSDNGSGIAADLLTHVLSPFVRAGQAGGDFPGGLGLGLAIAKSLTEMHGGSIAVASDGLGRGSTFTVRLPRLQQSLDRTVVAPPAPAPTRSHHPRRVMVVDDNEDLAESLGDLLDATGHHVLVFPDGIAALDRLGAFRPEVAVLDIGLPGIDGYDLAREIRGRLGHAAPFLIALTGFGQPGDVERSRKAGFDVHLVKPIDHRRLLHSIESAPR